MQAGRPRPLVAGNWKMNGSRGSTSVLRDIIEGYGAEQRAAVDLLVCPPATLIGAFRAAASGTGIAIGGQDCHAAPAGPHTGDISADMLADLGATHVIVGHSERRADHGETDLQIRAKAEAAHRAGLVAIICVGETRAERETGQALDIVARQLAGSVPDGASAAGLVIAYEPVWAIGTGLVPTTADIAAMHAMIRRELEGRTGEGATVRILYGGSVKPANAAQLLSVENVDGALVGGASLVAADFLGTARAYSA